MITLRHYRLQRASTGVRGTVCGSSNPVNCKPKLLLPARCGSFRMGSFPLAFIQKRYTPTRRGGSCNDRRFRPTDRPTCKGYEVEILVVTFICTNQKKTSMAEMCHGHPALPRRAPSLSACNKKGCAAPPGGGATSGLATATTCCVCSVGPRTPHPAVSLTSPTSLDPRCGTRPVGLGRTLHEVLVDHIR